MFSYDQTFVFVVIGFVLCCLAAVKVRVIFKNNKSVKSQNGITGRDAAEKILQTKGLFDVEIQRTSGKMTDHYDTRRRIMYLSDSSYYSESIAAVGIAAHECGHAALHDQGNMFFQIRETLDPFVRFCASSSWMLMLAGFVTEVKRADFILNLGILFFVGAVIFQIATLPVEVNASKIAVHMLENTDILVSGEMEQIKKILSAVSLMHIVSNISLVLTIFNIDLFEE